MLVAARIPGWQVAPLPPNEPARLACLRALAVLDSAAEPEFDALVAVASSVCGTPISLVSLVDADRQWFKARHGLDGVAQTPRDQAFCAHAILQDEILVVPDASADERFKGNPLVTADHGIRFYAGAPLRMSGGEMVGSLCVIDRQPRQLDAKQLDILRQLAQAAARALEGRQAAHLLARHTILLDTTLDAIADAVLTFDAAHLLTWMNPAAEALLGRGAAEVTGWPVDRLLPLQGPGLSEGWGPLLRATGAGQAVTLPADAELHRPGAPAAALAGTVSPLRSAADDAHTRPEGIVVVLRDESAARQASREIQHRATHDTLTGLVNRAEFERRLQQRLAIASTGTAEDCAVFIDLDHFKMVNDSCGHAAGDRLLQQVAAMLRDCVRASDTVARMGGDEFAILLCQCPMPVALRLGEQFCQRLEAFRFQADGQRMQIGASIGIAPVGDTLDTVAAVMQAADECCYVAKHGGRNRAVAWPQKAPPAAAAHSVARWAERIGRALDEDRFELFGQLVLPLHADAGVRQVEVLLRMRDDDGGIIAPGAFMPAAERFQLMPRIDRWVLSHALGWMVEHLAHSSVRRVGVNLSGQSIADSSFCRWALDHLRAAGPTLCAALTVEITETVALGKLEEAASFLSELRALGLRVALDDFGSGASTFSYLKHLPLDDLKIDGQFVRKLLTDRLDEISVRSFVDVARALGLKTVAECVENAEVLERLRSLGVDFAQGYHLHRPVPLMQLDTPPAA